MLHFFLFNHSSSIPTLKMAIKFSNKLVIKSFKIEI
jgi:hypothetical protein